METAKTLSQERLQESSSFPGVAPYTDSHGHDNEGNQVTETNQLGWGGQIGVVIGTYVLAEIFLIAMAFFWVFIYSMLIYADGNEAYYQSYA